MSFLSSSLLQCIVAIRSFTSLCDMLWRSHSSDVSLSLVMYEVNCSPWLGFSFSNSLRHLNSGLLTWKCVSRIAKQLVPWGRASNGTALPAMLCAATASVNMEVSLSIFPLSFAARTKSISLMSACCCSILSPFPKLELRKKALNSFVKILNSTGVAFLSCLVLFEQ